MSAASLCQFERQYIDEENLGHVVPSGIPIEFEDDARVGNWLSTASEEDSLFLRSMTEDRRAAALRRLSALLALDSGQIGVVDAGDRAGMARSAFHKLRGRWKANPSLQEIAPYATRRPRGADISEQSIRDGAIGRGKDSDPLIALVREAVLNHSDMSNGEIAKMLIDTMRDTPKRQTVTKIVQRMRHHLGLRPDVLRKTYGKRLLVDFCALGFIIRDADPEDCPIAAFAVERGSGYIFAATIERRSRALTAVRDALAKARSHIAREGLDIVREGASVAAVVLPDLKREQLEFMKSSDRRIAYAIAGERRFGQRLVSAIGPRIGKVQFKSSYTKEGSGVPELGPFPQSPPLSMHDIEMLVEHEVKRWNEPIYARLKDAKVLADRGCKNGAIDQTIGMIQEDIRSIAITD